MSIKKYFACGNTSKGFSNLFCTNIQQLNKLFILNGGSGLGKSDFMKKVGKQFEQLQYDVEYIHCPSDPDLLDGVIIPKLGVGIIDGIEVDVIEKIVPVAVLEYVNLGVGWDTDKLAAYTKEILNVENNMKQCYEKAYAEFAKALKVHDEWEKIYIGNMNFSKADMLTDKVIYMLLGTVGFNKTSVIKHRFFGGSTPYGSMDFVENITENIDKRYFIKGRPGTGKSTMLKKLLDKAQKKGIDAEVYHCGFDPDSLDMLLFPELNLCIFDSTAPHEYFPNRNSDAVIDMYAELVKAGTDDTYKSELTDIIARYKDYINKGTVYLAEAKKYKDQLEKYYIEASDFNIIDKIYENIYHKIMRFN